MTKRPLRLEEQRAWARIARSIRPLSGREAVDPSVLSMPEGQEERERPGAEKPIRGAKGQNQAKSGGTSHRASHQRATPEDRAGDRRVRRGQVAISARLDLHGHTQASAYRTLPVFLEAASSNGTRCVLVITGKGRLGEGVLRRGFLHWLETDTARRLVSGYAVAHQRHGGSGAFYVFLRRH